MLFLLQTYILELTEDYQLDFEPYDEVLIRRQKCCEFWLEPWDMEHYQAMKHNLLIKIRDAVIWKMYGGSPRVKREAGMCML